MLRILLTHVGFESVYYSFIYLFISNNFHSFLIVIHTFVITGTQNFKNITNEKYAKTKNKVILNSKNALSNLMH